MSGHFLRDLNELTLAPVGDTFVNRSQGTTNYGSDGTMRILGSGYLAYLKFDVSGIGTDPVTSATLRLTANATDIPDASVYSVTGSRDESTLTSDDDTLETGQQLDTVAGSTVNLNVLSVITGDGSYSFGLSTASQLTALKYITKEGSVSPKLIIQYEDIANNPNECPSRNRQNRPRRHSGMTGISRWSLTRPIVKYTPIDRHFYREANPVYP